MEKSKIRIYKNLKGNTSIEVKLDKETVWLNQYQLETLFQTNRTSISRHIRNIYKTDGLDENRTCAKIAQVRKEGKRTIERNIKYYNLDIIIAVGYRVNSKQGTEFRIWATQLLKEYLVKGFTINQEKLKKQNKQLLELKETVKILSNVVSNKKLSNDESKGLLEIISDYSYALDVLDKYDYQSLKIEDITTNEIYQLTYKEAIDKIQMTKRVYGNSDLFGHEKDKSFRSSIATIYQTFREVDLYPSIEEKAANLLYFVVKNHSFSDGNKRIAAFLFLYFLERNEILRTENGEKRIADNTLVALTLMIAVSKSEEKDTMVKIIVNLINKNNK
jgi:prophage maintenance system killer protein